MANNEDMDALHRAIIDDVIENVRSSFINMGIDEQVLIDLQESWESKLQQSKPIVTEPTDPEDPKEPANQTGNINQFHYGMHGTFTSNPMYPASTMSAVQNTSSGNADVSQESFLSQPAADSRVKRNISIAQLQAVPTNYTDIEFDEMAGPTKRLNNQLDGTYEAEEEEGGDDLTTTQDLGQSQQSYSNYYGGSSFNPENNSSSLSSSPTTEEEDVVDEECIENLVLCQYEKVTRTKNKWKCILKDGMLHINDQDYAFHRATCDFEW